MGATSYRFNDVFNEMVELIGAEHAYMICVENGDMEAWEFRFWMGHRGLV